MAAKLSGRAKVAGMARSYKGLPAATGRRGVALGFLDCIRATGGIDPPCLAGLGITGSV
jgi:hypothetical protein